jgi:hypothetical protein
MLNYIRTQYHNLFVAVTYYHNNGTAPRRGQHRKGQHIKIMKRKIERKQQGVKLFEFKNLEKKHLLTRKNDILLVLVSLSVMKDYKHKIHLKDNDPVYRKQFKIPESHLSFIEQSLDEWPKLGVVK